MASAQSKLVGNTEVTVLNGADVESIIQYHYHLRRLRQFVENNIGTAFQLADVASSIGISMSRLSHLFVEKTGLRYSDWIRTKRIEAALSLLSGDDRPSVLDVAIAVGYANIRSFERAFKKTMGLTATQYRFQNAPQKVSYL